MKTDAANILDAKSYRDFENALRDSDCQLCPLGATRTNIVIHRGNPNAKTMIIGEAPGEKEDLSGRAFVGRAGKMLDSVFESIGFDTNTDAIIANIVKCRPPKNRVPHKNEAKTCIDYLYKQISLIKPQVIILLGSTALRHILPEYKKKPMKEVVGKFIDHPDYKDTRLIVLYHPAYLLYDPRKKADMLEHLKFLKPYLNI